MASNYPGSLDSFDTIASDKKTSDSVGGRTHRQMHNDLGDAIEAVQGELGTTPSGSYATVKARFEAIEGSTLPQVDAKGDLIVGTADNTYDNLGVGTNDTVLLAASGETKGVKWAQVPTAAIQDGAVTVAKLGSDVRIGNLLTANQASIETDTTGWTASTGSPTIARSTVRALHGTASLLVTAAAASNLSVVASSPSSNWVPVTGGEAYTATASFYAGVNSRTALVSILFYASDGTTLLVQSDGPAITTGTGAWVEARHTAVAPATAAYARLAMIVNSAAISDTFNIDKVGLWRGTGGQWAMPGQPILGLTDAPIGNLLTANVASGTDSLGTTSGMTAANATIARSTAWAAEGTGSVLVTATAGNPDLFLTGIGTSGIAVTPGKVLTAVATVKAGTNVGRSGELAIDWYTAGGSYLSNNTASWTFSATPYTVTNTVTVPANAAYAVLAVSSYTAVAGETFYVDKAGLWFGAGGTWQMPGTPVIHTGIRPNPSNTAEVQIWNDATATWITV